MLLLHQVNMNNRCVFVFCFQNRCLVHFPFNLSCFPSFSYIFFFTSFHFPSAFYIFLYFSLSFSLSSIFFVAPLLAVTLFLNTFFFQNATEGRMMAHLQETPGFSLKCSGVKVLILDEADRLLDMGFKR